MIFPFCSAMTAAASARPLEYGLIRKSYLSSLISLVYSSWTRSFLLSSSYDLALNMAVVPSESLMPPPLLTSSIQSCSPCSCRTDSTLVLPVRETVKPMTIVFVSPPAEAVADPPPPADAVADPTPPGDDEPVPWHAT